MRYTEVLEVINTPQVIAVYQASQYLQGQAIYLFIDIFESKESDRYPCGFFMPEILAFVAGVFLKVRHNYAILNFRHKKRAWFAPKPLIYMVAIGGFEPPTPGL